MLRNLSLLIILVLVSAIIPFQAIAQDELPQFHLVNTIGRGTITAASWIHNDEQVAVAGSLGVGIYDKAFNEVAHIEAGNVDQLAVSTDDAYLATFGSQGLNIWDGANFQLLNQVNANGLITWKPNTHLLTIGSYDEIKIWNAETGEFEPSLPSLSQAIVDLVWSPDGTKLAVGEKNRLQIWDLLQGTAPLLVTLDNGGAGMTHPFHVAWSPDSLEIAVVADRSSPEMDFNSLTILSAVTGEVRLVIQAGTAADVDWSADGTLIATADSSFGSRVNTAINVWDSRTGEYVARMSQHSREAHTVDWHKDSRHLLSAAHDNTAVIVTIEPTYPVNASGEKKILRGHTGGVKVLDWSSDGTQIATGGDDGNVRFWKISSGEQLPIYFPADLREVQALDWSPDGRYLAAGGKQNVVRIRGVAEDVLSFSAEYEHGWTANPGSDSFGIANLSWSPDSKILASSGYDDQVYIWSLHAEWPYIVNQISDSGLSTHSVSWYPNGEQILLASGIVLNWNNRDGIPEKEYECDEIYTEGWTFGSTISPDGKYTIIFMSDGGLCLLDAQSGELIYYNSFYVRRIIWHPTSQWFMVIGGYFSPETKLFSVNSDEPQTLEITGISAAWSPDGRYLAIGQADGTVQIWEAELPPQ